MASWEIALRDKTTGHILTIKTDGSPVAEDRDYILPNTGGRLLTEEHLADPTNFPVEFKEAIKGDTGDGIESIVFLSTTDVSGLRGKPGATDTYQITLSNGEKSDFLVTNGLPNAELTATIQAAVESVIGAAPAALDTLAEIAAAIGNNSDFYNSIIQSLSLKADASAVYTKTQVDGFVAGLKTVPQVNKTAAYTLALTDGGSGVDTNSNVTIPLASSVNFPIGSVVTITNTSNANITLNAAAGVTLRQAGTLTSGAKTIGAYSVVHIRKVSSDTWFVTDAICIYNKSEIDAFINTLTIAVNTKANIADVYNKTTIDSLLGNKANVGDSYTKAEDDALLDLKADEASVYDKQYIDSVVNTINTAIASKPNSLNVYTKIEVDTIASGKLSTSGTAVAANKLATPRKINNVDFDGQANITINAVDSTARIASSEKGAVNGVATLGADGKVPSTQLPAYVDDVLEFANLASFPATGETGKIYVAIDTNKSYRWSGSVYVYITSGAVDSVNGQTGVVNITTITGNAGTATKLATARTIAIAGDATGSASFDGSANASISVTLANSGVVAGTYNASPTVNTPMAIDAKGRVTSIGAAVTITPAFSSITGKPTTVAGYGITDAYTQTDVNSLLAAKVASTEKGAANGVATLGADGKVPTTQLPAYVDDVLEYTALASFPATGESGKIYVANDTNKTYRWSGSAYIYITSGAVDSVNGQTGVVNITTITGNAGTATKLATARTISVSGDATASGSFDGSANLSLALTLANSGVVAGTYNASATVNTPIQVDAKGRVVAIGSNVTITPAFSSITGKPTTVAGYGITDAYIKTDVNSLLAAKVASTEKGAVNGVATLGADGKVPSAQLPSYVDDVLEYTALASFPATGESSKIYVDMATNKTYRWSGSVYTAITSGAVDSVNGQTGVVNITTITGNAGTATKLATARTISVSGDASGTTTFDGSANASMAVTLANSGVVAGTYNNSTTQQVPITVNAKGLVTAIGAAVTIAPAFGSISGKPTTIAGYGITDAYTKTESNTLLAAKVATAEKGAANGVATLGADGKVPTTQLPAYVDDVLEYTALASFPATGETGKIYVDLTTNKTYRWSGSAYIYITSGAVDSVNGQTGVVNITTITGNAGTATKLATARTISVSGDATASGSFDGSANLSLALTLANSGVVAGTYNASATVNTPIQVDAKGRVVAIGSNVTITPAFSSITGKPTTVAGYGITDAYTKTEIDTTVASLKMIPQVSKSAAYTLALVDGGSGIDTTSTVTVPDNAAVAFPIGTVISVTNVSAAAIAIIQGTNVVLRQAGTANTGNRTLAAYGVASMRKIATNTWFISGAGLA